MLNNLIRFGKGCFKDIFDIPKDAASARLLRHKTTVSRSPCCPGYDYSRSMMLSTSPLDSMTSVASPRALRKASVPPRMAKCPTARLDYSYCVMGGRDELGESALQRRSFVQIPPAYQNIQSLNGQTPSKLGAGPGSALATAKSQGRFSIFG
jgi:hypothetical protein